MTKEELEKEAEEIYIKTDKEFMDCQDEGEIFNLGYLAGAEPREKQIQIDAEQIRALQKQNGELTDKVKKLEAEVREWKDKADLWCKTANLKDHNIMINKELEKENAELKDYRLNTMAKEQTEMSKYALNLEHKLGWYDTQLTKAKEIIKAFLDSSDLNIKHKAEEFLGEF